MQPLCSHLLRSMITLSNNQYCTSTDHLKTDLSSFSTTNYLEIKINAKKVCYKRFIDLCDLCMIFA